MRVKFFNVKEIANNVKCAIHRSGKLGFSGAAINKLGLNSDKSISIGINSEDRGDQNLYMKVHDHSNDEAFPITKSGEYCYINTKAMFDSLGIDYRNKRIIYDIVDFTFEGGEQGYKLIKREVKNKKLQA